MKCVARKILRKYKMAGGGDAGYRRRNECVAIRRSVGASDLRLSLPHCASCLGAMGGFWTGRVARQTLSRRIARSPINSNGACQCLTSGNRGNSNPSRPTQTRMVTAKRPSSTNSPISSRNIVFTYQCPACAQRENDTVECSRARPRESLRSNQGLTNPLRAMTS
jgi:hypothetical protein